MSTVNGLLSALLAHIICSGRPVMPIGHIERIDLLKLLLKELRVLNCALPEDVANPILTADITPWLSAGRYLLHLVSDGVLVLPESQEHWAHIGTLNIGQLSSVELFFGESVFVFLDPVLFVVLD